MKAIHYLPKLHLTSFSSDMHHLPIASKEKTQSTFKKIYRPPTNERFRYTSCQGEKIKKKKDTYNSLNSQQLILLAKDNLQYCKPNKRIFFHLLEAFLLSLLSSISVFFDVLCRTKTLSTAWVQFVWKILVKIPNLRSTLDSQLLLK